MSVRIVKRLEDLDDVEFDSLSDAQGLEYDFINEVWVNADIAGHGSELQWDYTGSVSISSTTPTTVLTIPVLANESNAVSFDIAGTKSDQTNAILMNYDLVYSNGTGIPDVHYIQQSQLSTSDNDDVVVSVTASTNEIQVKVACVSNSVSYLVNGYWKEK